MVQWPAVCFLRGNLKYEREHENAGRRGAAPTMKSLPSRSGQGARLWRQAPTLCLHRSLPPPNQPPPEARGTLQVAEIKNGG